MHNTYIVYCTVLYGTKIGRTAGCPSRRSVAIACTRHMAWHSDTVTQGHRGTAGGGGSVPCVRGWCAGWGTVYDVRNNVRQAVPELRRYATVPTDAARGGHRHARHEQGQMRAGRTSLGSTGARKRRKCSRIELYPAGIGGGSHLFLHAAEVNGDAEVVVLDPRPGHRLGALAQLAMHLRRTTHTQGRPGHTVQGALWKCWQYPPHTCAPVTGVTGVVLSHGLCPLCLVPGAWCLVPGAWCLVPGAWCLVPGAWCLVTYLLHEGGELLGWLEQNHLVALSTPRGTTAQGGTPGSTHT